MGEPHELTAPDYRDELVGRSRNVLAEVESATVWLSARSDEWLGTLRDVHASAYRGDPAADHLVVDVELLTTYRRMFDQLAEFAMMVDPYVLDLRDQDLL